MTECAGQVIPASCLVVAGYVGCNHVLAVLAVTLAVGIAGLALSGYQVNHLDIAPPYAGGLCHLYDIFQLLRLKMCLTCMVYTSTLMFIAISRSSFPLYMYYNIILLAWPARET